ncbi:MAG: prepilin peptidase [Saccharofermentans sp.]|nr:prepilin peptidase [Saccharofermentans sp.]
MNSIVLFLYVFFAVWATIFGIIIGSFLNVVIYRIPEGRTIVKGHSMCMSCGHTLTAKDLVPLFSWLFLKGKCRYCGAPVPSRYARIESFTGLVFLIVAISRIETAFVIVEPSVFYLTLLFNFVLFLVACCVSISAMMIYHDTKKGFIQLSLISVVSGLISTIITNYRNNASVTNHILSITISIALLSLGCFVIKLIFSLFHKTYNKSDLFADATLLGLFFNCDYTIIFTKLGTVITSIIEISCFAVIYGLIRATLKGKKKDDNSIIYGFILIVILVIIRYSIMKFVYNY